jgi:hypothetical protein
VARFLLFAALVIAGVHQLPNLARLLLDPGSLMSHASLSPKTGKLLAFGFPVSLLAIAFLLAFHQRLFAFEGRRVALRKQAWVLYGEFREAITGHFEEGEQPIAYRVVDPPELSSSLLLRLGFFWLALVLILLAVVTPLALRIHWPIQGHLIWYQATGTLSLLGLVLLARFRTPPVLRLFLQSAIPALHFGHGLLMGGSPLTPLGLPALPLDLILGLLTGWAGYRFGQRERGGSLLILTTCGARSFDPAGQQTTQIGKVLPLKTIRFRRTPAGAEADFLDPEGQGLRSLSFEDPASVEEIPTLLAARGVKVNLEEIPPRVGPLAVLAEPGLLGWLVLLLMAGSCTRLGQHLLITQSFLKQHLLRHLPAWSQGDPHPLLAGARTCLAEDPHFYPAQVFQAVALFDLGQLDQASKELHQLTRQGPLRGFAARTLPSRLEAVKALFSLSTTIQNPGARADAEAGYLLSEVRGPHAVRQALKQILCLPKSQRGPQSALLEGLAYLDLSHFPEALWTDPPLPAAQYIARARELAEDLAGDQQAFVRSSLFLETGEVPRALDAAQGHSGLVTLVGRRGEELASQLLLHLLVAVQTQLKRLPQAHKLLQFAKGTPSQTSGWSQQLKFAEVAFLPENQAREKLEALPPPQSPSLWQVLAEENAGKTEWAKYHAYQLLGTGVAQTPDPDRLPSLAPLPPLLRRYFLALALQSLEQTQSARGLLLSLKNQPDFPWQTWLTRRGI